MLRRLASLVLAATVLVAACDRTPTDPLFDVESMLAATDPAAAAGIRPLASTLPALFRESIANVEKQGGRPAVEALLSDWRRLQEELKTQAPTSNRATVQEKLAAIHDEELNVVITALSQRVVARVIDETASELAEARTQIAAQRIDGAALTRIGAVAQEVQLKLAFAERSLSANKHRDALDLASQAAAVLGGLDFYLVEIGRIPGLETFLPQAINKLRQDASPAAQTLLAQVEQNDKVAQAALRSGDRVTAQRELGNVRTQQIQLVLSVLGPTTATKLVDQVAARADETRAIVATLDTNTFDVPRYQRMLNEAADLTKRARIAAAAGDGANALDLGSHAAGLLNALQHLIRK